MTRVATQSTHVDAGKYCRRFLRAGEGPRRPPTLVRASTAALLSVVIAALAIGSSLPPLEPMHAQPRTLRETILPAAQLSQRFAAASSGASDQPIRAFSFTFHDGDQEITLIGQPGTVGEALNSHGIVVGSVDRLTPAFHEALYPGQKVFLRRARTILLGLRGQDVAVHTHATTVGELLRERGIVLEPDDHVSAAPEARLIDGMTVRVGRERLERIEVLDTLPFQSIRRLDPTLSVGESRREMGRRGIIHRETEITYAQGKEIGRRVIREWVDPPPKDEIVYEGTKPAVLATAPDPRRVQGTGGATATVTTIAQAAATAVAAVSVPTASVAREAAGTGRSIKPTATPVVLTKGQRIRVYATWYNAASAGTPKDDPWYGKTATGVKVDRGVVAVDPKVIPLGTKLFIPGYGAAVAADTGSAVIGDIIDLGFPDGMTPDWKPRWIEITVAE